MGADIKALKAALAARKAEHADAVAEVKYLQGKLEEAEIALRLAQPLGKSLAKLLAESAESGGAWIDTLPRRPQRIALAGELRRLGLAEVGRQDFRCYRLVITDAGRVRLAAEAAR